MRQQLGDIEIDLQLLVEAGSLSAIATQRLLDRAGPLYSVEGAIAIE